MKAKGGAMAVTEDVKQIEDELKKAKEAAHDAAEKARRFKEKVEHQTGEDKDNANDDLATDLGRLMGIGL